MRQYRYGDVAPQAIFYFFVEEVILELDAQISADFQLS